MEIHPVTVIVPHRSDRREFFNSRCLPSIRENSPAQLLLEEGPSSAQEKVNSGSIKAIQPYIAIAPDNVILRSGSIKKMVDLAEKNPRSSIVYGDFDIVPYSDILSPMTRGSKKAGPWSLERLYRGNFIGGAFLMKREGFIWLDSTTDLYLWDLFIRMAKAGVQVSYIPETLSEVHYLDVHGSSDRDKFVNDLRGLKSRHPEIM